jgi:hypothetical protein
MSSPANIASLRWAKQSGQGTAVADGAYVFGARLAGGTQVEPARTDNPFNETTGGRMLSDYYASEAHAAGDPQHYLMPLSGTSLLYGCLGAVNTSGSGDPYTHTITAATSRPWWTVRRMLANLIWERFVDCKVDKIVIQGSTGQPLMITASWLGISPQAETADDSTVGIIEITNRYLFYDGQAALKFEGSAVASISDFTLTISNNGQAIGGDSFSPIDISEGELTVELQITKLLLAASLRNRLFYNASSPSANTAAVGQVLELAGSPAGVDFTFTRSATRTLELAVPRLMLAPYSNQPTTNPTDILRDVLTLNALAPADGSSPITCTSKTGRATAY